MLDILLGSEENWVEIKGAENRRYVSKI